MRRTHQARTNTLSRGSLSSHSDYCWFNGTLYGGYFTNGGVERRLLALHCRYPECVREPRVIGSTAQHRDIFAYDVTLGLADDALLRNERPTLFVVGLLQSRDVLTLAASLYAIEEICRRTHAHDDPELERALSAVQLVVVPVVAVDAFVADVADNPHGGGCVWDRGPLLLRATAHSPVDFLRERAKNNRAFNADERRKAKLERGHQGDTSCLPGT